MKSFFCSVLLMLLAGNFVGLCRAKEKSGNVEWEVRLPNGAETNAQALNRAAGTAAGGVADQVREAKGELQPLTFPGLKPKVPHEGIFEVRLANEGVVLPPDMGGAGPFHLLKANGSYFLLTPRNFARLFGPVSAPAEVLPLVKAYEKLFGERSAEVVTSVKDVKGFQKIAPPGATDVQEIADGWDVRLVLYSAYRKRAFYEKRLRVRRDGTVEVTAPAKLVKEIGPGFMY